MRWRVVFMGTAEIACPTLRALAAMPELELTGVYTQPDRPRGRGQTLQFSPVKQLAIELGLPVFQSAELRSDVEYEALKVLSPDVLVVMAYGQILTQRFLELPPLGAVNLHASLLPRHRGASPIQHAILDGDAETGVTLMEMEVTLDSGPMIAKAAIPLSERDTGETVHDRLAVLASDLARNKLPDYLRGNLKGVPQCDDFATYTGKISKQNGQINWRENAEMIERRIRAYTPWPGTYTHLPVKQQSRLKILSATVSDGEGLPGQALSRSDDQIEIATGEGSLILERVQREGSRPATGRDFLNGFPLSAATFLS